MAINPSLPPGERIYAIGDIHGRADLLTELLAAIRRDNDARSNVEVRLILVGDLIDRGPASADVVEQCRALAASYDHFIVLKGNHEAVMVDALRGSFPALAFWLDHGGNATLTSWGVATHLAAEGPSRNLFAAAKAHVPSEVTAWLGSLPLSYRRGNCLFVHAGIRPGVPLDKQTATDLLWIRDDFIDSTTPHPYVVVHGHTIEEAGPCLRHGRLGIDTGAYRTGRLTAVGIEGDDYWTLSTGTRPFTPHDAGEISPIDESVEAILAFDGPGATISPRSRRSTRKLAIASLAAAFLAAGTVKVLKYYGRTPTSTAPSAAAVFPSTASRSGTMPRENATMRSPAVPRPPAVDNGAGARGVAAVLETANRALREPLGIRQAFPTRYVDARDARSTLSSNRDAAKKVAPGGPSIVIRPRPASAPLVPEQVATVAIPSPGNAAIPHASVIETLGRAPVGSDEAIVVARSTPLPIPPPRNTKERAEAVDAIRLLRRQ